MTEWCLDESPVEAESTQQSDGGIIGGTERATQSITESPTFDFQFPDTPDIQPVESAPSEYRTNFISELKRLKRLGIL